jgi:broad specificity phosphatase PhoE
MPQRRFLLLVRHPEAEKNLTASFGGGEVGDVITDLGLSQVQELARAIRAWLDVLGGADVRVFSSNAARLADCANVVSEATGGERSTDPRLASILKGRISGLAESVVGKEFPRYYRKLRLYRMGLLNSYGIDHPGEGLQAFEERVGA